MSDGATTWHPIEFQDEDAWDDTALIKAYDRAISTYHEAHGTTPGGHVRTEYRQPKRCASNNAWASPPAYSHGHDAVCAAGGLQRRRRVRRRRLQTRRVTPTSTTRTKPRTRTQQIFWPRLRLRRKQTRRQRLRRRPRLRPSLQRRRQQKRMQQLRQQLQTSRRQLDWTRGRGTTRGSKRRLTSSRLRHRTPRGRAPLAAAAAAVAVAAAAAPCLIMRMLPCRAAGRQARMEARKAWVHRRHLRRQVHAHVASAPAAVRAAQVAATTRAT